MFHINLWKFPIFSLFQWNFSISTSTLQNSIFDNIIFQLVLSIIEVSPRYSDMYGSNTANIQARISKAG